MSFSTRYGSFRRIRLIRYLVAWRVNSSLVTLPKCFAVELSQVLGTIISNRLPTREAAPWQKALSPLNQYFDTDPGGGKGPHKAAHVPDVSWPIDSVLFVHPGKSTYGLGELIFWELKLFGDGADHGFFLETILPAMEEAGYTTDPRWNRTNKIWGRFEIQAVYAARGSSWEPLVSNGRLDTRARVTASQWADGLTFGAHVDRPLRQLIWLTPFKLQGLTDGSRASADDNQAEATNRLAFTMTAVLNGLLLRLTLPAPGRRKGADYARVVLDGDGLFILREALLQAIQAPLLFKDLEPVSRKCPGQWTGKHVFAPIPREIIPCLELASILHIGKYVHFGCGTFRLE